MAEFDLFANQLWEESKRFFEKGIEASEASSQEANLHAALMLGFCALEAHVNAIGEEFSVAKNLSLHEKALLLEKEVRLENGEFKLTAILKMAKLEDRMRFLHLKFSGHPIDTSSAWWGKFKQALQLRNDLTHAKAIPSVTKKAVKDALQAMLDALDALYKAIYKKKFPPVGQGLQSSLIF